MQDPKMLHYVPRLEKVVRIVKAAQFRVDQKLATRELCEALLELAGALLDREQANSPGAKPPTAG